MKFTSYNIQTLWKQIKKGDIKGVVIYGSDHGLIKHRCDEIKQLLSASTRMYKYSDVARSDFVAILNTGDLFCTREIIIVYDAPSNISSDLKSSLNSNIKNFLVLLSNEFITNSTTVKWFGEQSFLAALGCYTDSNDIIQLISTRVRQVGKDIADDATEYFAKTIYNDRECCLTEINKLLTYCHDRKHISIKEVERCMGTGILGSADLMCIYFARQQEENYYNEVNKLKSSYVPEIWIIKALIRFFINLYTVLIRCKGGVSIRDAIKLINPPIFFKYVQDFYLIVQTKTLQEVVHTLYILYELELEFKTRYSNIDFPTQAFLRVNCN